ncbi:hypothetical protein C2G38_2273958, partial [Gigaspora rosea]
FGQKEELTTRLKNILRDYNRKEIVFKEFLQNADDAAASQFCVILDDSQYSTKYLLKPDTMNCWQGPAIWIYNDAQFSKEDFNSLCNIGKVVNNYNMIKLENLVLDLIHLIISQIYHN